jgi:hypothetical protein
VPGEAVCVPDGRAGRRRHLPRHHGAQRVQRPEVRADRGLARCGICGAALIGSMKQRTNDTMPYLLCHPSHGGRACVAIMLLPVEQYVVDELFRQLDKPEFLNAIAADDHAERRE